MQAEQSKPTTLRMQVIFNNVVYDKKLATGWGFACLIEGLPQVMLFDTGADGTVLLANMKKMGIDPKTVETVFLSHDHWDHTGGLEVLLRTNPKVLVYLPASLPPSFRELIAALGSQFKILNNFEKLGEQVYTTGELDAGIKEQSLIIETSQGLVIITGCAHPGIVQIVSHTRERLGKKIYLVMGGFHLEGLSLRRLQQIADELKKLGVEKIAPSHCTGNAARELFRDKWGENFLESGVGAIIELRP